MTTPTMLSEDDRGPKVDAGRLWAGGLATALVAALIALVGILIARWLAKVPILAPSSEGSWGNAHTGDYVLAAAGAAIVATALMHLLLLATPEPTVFFGWIIALATLAAVVFPFSTSASTSQKIATAVINLILGIAIGSLTNGVARRAVRRRPRRPAAPLPGDRDYLPPQQYPPSQQYPRSQQPYPPSQQQQYPPSRYPGSQGYTRPNQDYTPGSPGQGTPPNNQGS